MMFLAVLGVLGTTATVMTTTDIKIGANHEASVQSHYVSLSGIEEARNRLSLPSSDANYIGQSGALDANWRAYLGDAGEASSAFGSESYDSGDSHHFLYSSMQANMEYAVMIQHKTDGSGNVLLWGDSDGDYINEENTTTGQPIEVIRSRGSSGGSDNVVMVVVIAELPFFVPPAALYVNGNLDKSGAAGGAWGSYNPHCPPNNDIVTTVNAGACPPKNCEATDWPAGATMPTPQLVNGWSDIYPVSDVLSTLGGIADNTVAPGSYRNPSGWGSASSPYEITYCNGDLSVRNLTGYGILAVNGDVTVAGNVGWNGIIIVSGITKISGGGTLDVYGSVISDSMTTINGTPRIYYDCNVVDDLNSNNMNYTLTSWKESY